MNSLVKITASWERMVGHLAANGETPNAIAAVKDTLAHYPSITANGRTVFKGTSSGGTLGQYIMYCPKGATMVLILSGTELTAFLHENGTSATETLRILTTAATDGTANYGRATVQPTPANSTQPGKFVVTIK